MEKSFRVVPVSSIHSQAFVLSDREFVNDERSHDSIAETYSILSVRSTNEWSNFFIDTSLDNKDDHEVLFEFLQPNSSSNTSTNISEGAGLVLI